MANQITKDKYDHAIDYLTEHPEDIEDAWCSPFEWIGRGGELFQFAWKDGYEPGCGCLTQIRGDGAEAETWELTLAIQNDESIPCSESDITVEDLSHFAYWQRRLDKVLGRDGERT